MTNTFSYTFTADEAYWINIDFNKTTSSMSVDLEWDFGSGSVKTGNSYVKIPYNLANTFIASSSVTPFSGSCSGSGSGSGDGSGDSASSNSTATTISVSTNVPNRIEGIGSAIIGLTCVTIIFGFINQALSAKPVWAVFGLIYHIQFLLLLPLIKIVMHNDIISLFDFLNFYLFNFSFLPDVVRFTDSKDTNSNAISQTNSYLYRIELKIGSAFYNMGELIFVLCLFIAVYLTVVLMYAIARVTSTQSGFYKFSKYIFDMFHFSVIIRFLLLAYMFILLCALSEMGITNKEGDQGKSYTFAIFSFIFGLAILALICLSWIFSKNEKSHTNLRRSHETFRGTRDSFIARTFPVVFFAKILLFVIIVCTMGHSARFGTLTILFIVQLVYIAYIAILRPFNHIVETLVELFNGIMYAIALLALYFLDKESRWTDSVTNWYLSFIIITVIINALIMIGKFGFKLIISPI